MTGRITHGHTRGRKTTPTFRSWCAMLQRCLDPNAEKYPKYGGAGIKVCKRWRSFEKFLEDMGERPAGTTLDRFPNRRGNYAPCNCRWATPKQQVANRDPFVNSNTAKTHCPAGHPYAGSNVRVTKGGRKCRECDRLRAQAIRAAKKGK